MLEKIIFFFPIIFTIHSCKFLVFSKSFPQPASHETRLWISKPDFEITFLTSFPSKTEVDNNQDDQQSHQTDDRDIHRVSDPSLLSW